MNDWGVPDWQQAEGYENQGWNINQWRWQFLRRRQDLRDEFDARAPAVYAEKQDLFAADPSLFPDGYVKTPEMPGFFVSTQLIHGGLERLPNPRISEQPCYAIAWADRTDAWRRPVGREQDGFLQFEFDLDRPIGPQLKYAEQTLKEFQRLRVGKLVQFRQHREKWPLYLRVLDARAAGASWDQVAGILPPMLSKNTVGTARSVHEQAEAIGFNFPF